MLAPHSNNALVTSISGNLWEYVLLKIHLGSIKMQYHRAKCSGSTFERCIGGREGLKF